MSHPYRPDGPPQPRTGRWRAITAWALFTATCLAAGYWGLAYLTAIPWAAAVSIRGIISLFITNMVILFALGLAALRALANLREQGDAATDDADRAIAALEHAHDRIDVLVTRQEQLATAHAGHVHPMPDHAGDPATNPYGMPAQVPTEPAPAIDLTGGARLPVRGRHAAPDTGTTPAVTRANSA